MGVDLWCAEKVFELKKTIPDIQPHFYLPCETQANKWPENWRDKYFNLLATSNNVTLIQYAYSSDCMFRRNRAMVDASSRLIAVHDRKRLTGGTAYTIKYAQMNGVAVFRVWTFAIRM